MGEARYLLRLNPAVFDSMAIDAPRRGKMPAPEDWVKGTMLNMKEVRRLTSGEFGFRRHPRWILKVGQQYAAPLQYAPLPPAVVKSSLARME